MATTRRSGKSPWPVGSPNSRSCMRTSDFNCSSSIDIYDLRTGGPGQVFTTGCSYPGPYTPSGIDSLALNANGFGAWRTSSIPYAPVALTGVSCPSVSLCVATDDVGNLATTTDPIAGRAAW